MPITVQPTPNPNALKFVLDVVVKSKDSAVYKQGTNPGTNKIAEGILAIPGVTEVYFASRFITVTQNGSVDWDHLEGAVNGVITAHITAHDPDFQVTTEVKPAAPAGSELERINDILDRTIRPALQRDGGDLAVISLEGKVLTISYQGACGCCPHAAMGTLYAIQNILQDQYDPAVTVEMA